MKQFARIANETSFLYVYHIIQANNRQPFNSNANSSTSSLLTPSLLTTQSFTSFSTDLPVPKAHQRVSSSVPGGQASDEADLDAFFPFDPYNLPVSSRFISPIYLDWDAEDSDDDDSDEEENESDSGESIEEEAGDRFPESLERQPGYRIPPTAAATGTRRGRKTSGGRTGGRLLGASFEEDEEVDMLGKSLEGAMSISPGMGLASRMGLHLGRVGGGAGATEGGKEVRWV